MKSEALLLILLVFTLSVSAQPEYLENQIQFEDRPEPEESEEPESVCGDGICDPMESGICVEDCSNVSDPNAPQNPEESGTENSELTNQENAGNMSSGSDITGTISENIEIVGIGAGALILLSLIAVKLMDRKEEGDEDLKDYSGWARDQMEQGFSEKQIRNFMRQHGASQEEIDYALRNA